jgi:hypothetical protein
MTKQKSFDRQHCVMRNRKKNARNLTMCTKLVMCVVLFILLEERAELLPSLGFLSTPEYEKRKKKATGSPDPSPPNSIGKRSKPEKGTDERESKEPKPRSPRTKNFDADDEYRSASNGRGRYGSSSRGTNRGANGQRGMGGKQSSFH